MASMCMYEWEREHDTMHNHGRGGMNTFTWCYDNHTSTSSFYTFSISFAIYQVSTQSESQFTVMHNVQTSYIQNVWVRLKSYPLKKNTSTDISMQMPSFSTSQIFNMTETSKLRCVSTVRIENAHRFYSFRRENVAYFKQKNLFYLPLK